MSGGETRHNTPRGTTISGIDKLISASHTFSFIMATRSRIGIQLKDNSVLSVYHHWDGYPSWLGRILTTHYNSRELASELIDGGDMSAAWGDENRAEYYSERGADCPPRLDDIFDFLYKKNNEQSA